MQFTFIENCLPLTPMTEMGDQGVPSGTPETADASAFAGLVGNALDSLRLVRPPGGAVPEGQEVATEPETGELAEGEKKTGDAGAAAAIDLPLMAVPLGPSLHVITVTEASPDSVSLHDFARAQGLDERAIQWLFGKESRPAAGNNPPAVMPGLALDTGSAQTAFSRDAWMLSGRTAGLDNTFSGGDSLKPRLDGLAMGTAGLPGMSGTPSAADVSAGASIENKMPPPDAGSMSIQTVDLTAEINDWLKSLTTAGNAVASGAGAARSIDGNADHAPALIDPMTQWSQKMAAASALWIPAVGGSDPSLPLPDDMQPDLTSQQSEGARIDLPGPLRAAVAATADNAVKPTLESLLQQRNDESQRLAYRMGEAVAQRMVHEIASGNWQFKMSLKPATLGRIDIDMRMHEGALNASFAANHGLTRDLLNDGLLRLRDTLTQAGMDVAQLQVGDGQARRDGGDPTPRQQAPWQAASTNESVKTTEDIPDAAINSGGASGLDVLV